MYFILLLLLFFYRLLAAMEKKFDLNNFIWENHFVRDASTFVIDLSVIQYDYVCAWMRLQNPVRCFFFLQKIERKSVITFISDWIGRRLSCNHFALLLLLLLQLYVFTLKVRLLYWCVALSKLPLKDEKREDRKKQCQKQQRYIPHNRFYK